MNYATALIHATDKLIIVSEPDFRNVEIYSVVNETIGKKLGSFSTEDAADNRIHYLNSLRVQLFAMAI